VNDAFVMFQWGRHQGVEKVKMLPDGSATFTEGMGMLVKKDNLGFGERSWRYSMLVEDGEIQKVFSEPGKEDDCPTDPFEVSDADTMLNYIRGLNSTRAA
jgi:peroxiredoxin